MTPFVHDRALCESTDVGDGTRVWAFAHITAGARVGRDCNVCDHAYIEGGAVVGDRVTVKNNVAIWEKVTVEDEVFLGPNMVFTNDLVPRVGSGHTSADFLATLVRHNSSIGANATIVCGVTIGHHAFVGAGAVVVDDVAAHAIVLGNPAVPRGWMCACGGRLDDTLTCPACGRGYTLVSATEGLRAR
jgi:acetyltransferase-like isoleucine patch superfamily enzyme